RVAVTRNTSKPSDAYFASVPPTPSDSSSGCARTAISVRPLLEVIAVRSSLRDFRFEIGARHHQARRRLTIGPCRAICGDGWRPSVDAVPRTLADAAGVAP